MPSKKYRVTHTGLNILEKGVMRQLEVGEEFTHNDLPDFWASKVEEVNSAGAKEFEVATPKEDEEKKSVRNKK